MDFDTVMSRQTKYHSLIYYEIGIHFFNCRFSHMKHDRTIPSIMTPMMATSFSSISEWYFY